MKSYFKVNKFNTKSKINEKKKNRLIDSDDYFNF